MPSTSWLMTRCTTLSAKLSTTLVAALALPLLALPAGAQEKSEGQESRDSAFTWTGRVAPGGWVRVRNMNGPVRVEGTSNGEIEVRAVKRRGRRGDPQDVRIEVRRSGDGDGDVLICALWYENASCDEHGYQSNSSGWRQNDTEVSFTVRLPRDVRVAASTVNGGLEIDDVTSEVDASTVNGEVEATTSGGPVNASTVNGDIRVGMGALEGDDDLRYSTVNGSVTVELPPTVDADVEMSTVNGGLSADYPLTVQGRVSPRRIRATIGKGGRRMEFKTVNGSVRLVKRE